MKFIVQRVRYNSWIINISWLLKCWRQTYIIKLCRVCKVIILGEVARGSLILAASNEKFAWNFHSLSPLLSYQLFDNTDPLWLRKDSIPGLGTLSCWISSLEVSRDVIGTVSCRYLRLKPISNLLYDIERCELRLPTSFVGLLIESTFMVTGDLHIFK